PSELRTLEAAFSDIRVVEVGSELGEWAGKLLAMNGAQVIRVEPPGGGPGRRIGPFYGGGLVEPAGDPEASLYHWHYNAGKKGVALDLEAEEGRAQLRALLETADVLIESHPPGYLAERGLDLEALCAANPRLVAVSLTDFGPDGPWRDYRASDLVHLA